MYLKTNNLVTVNKPLSGTEEIIVIGALQIEQYNAGTDLRSLFSYGYFNDSNGEVVSSGVFEADSIQKDEIYRAVSDTLPDINVVGFSEWYEKLTFEAFRFEMAQSLGIATSEISIEQGDPSFGQE